MPYNYDNKSPTRYHVLPVQYALAAEFVNANFVKSLVGVDDKPGNPVPFSNRTSPAPNLITETCVPAIRPDGNFIFIVLPEFAKIVLSWCVCNTSKSALTGTGAFGSFVIEPYIVIPLLSALNYSTLLENNDTTPLAAPPPTIGLNNPVSPSKPNA